MNPYCCSLIVTWLLNLASTTLSHKGYCKTIYNRNGNNYFWSVDNSREVFDKLNIVNNYSSINTYDFSTLYSNLPLDLVRNELFEMIDRYFDIIERKSNKYIVLNHLWRTAQVASVDRKGSYGRDKLRTALDYLLFKSFVRFGPHVFKQIKDIPMGSNASPLIADLILANLQFRYMDKLVSSKSPDKLRMSKKLSNNSRYIDDIGVCNMNNINDFMICSKGIYPDSIPLTAGFIENHKDAFLDLAVTIDENRFITKIYYKLDDLDFEVIIFPFLPSNMSDHITCNSFYSQLVRFSFVCSKFIDFDIRSRNLLESLLNRVFFLKYRLKNSFKKFVLNHRDVLDIKYTMDEINEFIISF